MLYQRPILITSIILVFLLASGAIFVFATSGSDAELNRRAGMAVEPTPLTTVITTETIDTAAHTIARNLVNVNGIVYWGVEWNDSGLPDPAELGPEIARVTNKVSDLGPGSEHALQESEATVLPAGTTLHSVNGYDPTFRLIAETTGTRYLYHAAINPRARTGADLLDLDGKVQAIQIEEIIATYNTKERIVVINRTVEIRDQDTVGTLVSMVLHAPVAVGTMRPSSMFPTVYRLSFAMTDGSSVDYRYVPDRGSASFYWIPPISATTIALPLAFQAAFDSPLP